MTRCPRSGRSRISRPLVSNGCLSHAMYGSPTPSSHPCNDQPERDVMSINSLDGVLIVNADDWGRDAETTARIAECVVPGGVSSVSAMVFMADSERAADTARERGIDAGLHVNFTTPFSAPGL